MANLTVSLEVKGLAQMSEILDRLPAEVAGPILSDALAASGEVIRAQAAANIHSKTGETAAALRVQVQVDPAKQTGTAAIDAGKLTFKLRWLEFGAVGKKSGGRGWIIKGGTTDAREARRARRLLRSVGAVQSARLLAQGIASGRITTRKNLKLPDGHFRRQVFHPGIRPQAPLTKALIASAQIALDRFAATAWRGIQNAVKRFPMAA